MGNVRLSYTDANKNQSISTSEIIEENHYYAYGLKHQGYNTLYNVQNGNSVAQRLKYNGKEYEDALNFNIYEYGARNYMPDLGRFFNIDRFAEVYHDMSTYQYAGNNPSKFIDVNGDYISVVGEKGTTYFYRNGKLYTSSKFDVEYTPDEGSYEDKILQSLISIADGGEGSFGYFVLNLFDNDKVNARISLDTQDKTENYTVGQAIYTSFSQRLTGATTDGKSNANAPFYIGLFHEIAHAYANQVFSKSLQNEVWVEYKDKEFTSKSIKKAEIFAVMYENNLRGEKGLPLRTHYSHPNDAYDYSELQKSRILFEVKSEDGTIKYEPNAAINAIYKTIINSKPDNSGNKN